MLEGLAWRHSERKSVATLIGQLFESATPSMRQPVCLGTFAFSAAWPVSDIEQLGVHTHVRARFLRRPSSGRSHFGTYPLYEVDEESLTNVRADDRVRAGFEGLGTSAGVARPSTRHDDMLPWLPRDGLVQPSVSSTTPQGPFRVAASEKRGRDDGGVQPSVSSTPQQDRVAAARQRGAEAWEELWQAEEQLERAMSCQIPRSLTGVAPGVTIAAAEESVRLARVRKDGYVTEANQLEDELWAVAAATTPTMAAAAKRVEADREMRRSAAEKRVVGKQGSRIMSRQKLALHRFYHPAAPQPPVAGVAPQASTRQQEPAFEQAAVLDAAPPQTDRVATTLFDDFGLTEDALWAAAFSPSAFQ